MEKPRNRRAEMAEGTPAEEPTSQPIEAAAEERVERARRRNEDPKVKVTFSLPGSLARLIDSVSAELRVAPCELVAQLLRPALKGCSKPTVPEQLRALFPQKDRSAA